MWTESELHIVYEAQIVGLIVWSFVTEITLFDEVDFILFVVENDWNAVFGV